jgi:hypothetical protein
VETRQSFAFHVGAKADGCRSIRRKASAVTRAATSTATISRGGCDFRTASTAAFIVAPVANPSSTRTTIRC